jgi:hypothetical protein
MNLIKLAYNIGNKIISYQPQAAFEEFNAFRLDWLINRTLKFYPQSMVDKVLENRRSNSTDEAVIEDFKSFEQPRHIVPKDDNYFRAVNLTRQMFKPAHMLFPISFPDLRYYPWRLKPSIEAPWNLETFSFTPTFRNLDEESETPKIREDLEKLMLKATRTIKWLWHGRIRVGDYLRIKQAIGIIDNNRRTFHNLYNEIFQYNRTLVHQIKEGSTKFFKLDGTPIPYYWNTLHARAHVVSKDEPDKIRAVFGATKLLLMVENMFIWALQSVYLNTETGNLLWGREIMKGGWLKLFNEINFHGKPSTFLTLDWSQFDKRLLFQVMDDVHAIWRSYFDFNWYQPTSFYPQATPRDPQRIERLWKWMCYSIKHTPILLPNGELYQWTHSGFGSGYQQTQLMDSFANMIMILTCLAAMGIKIEAESFWIRVQGDDSLVAFFEYVYRLYGPDFLTKLADTAMFYFNAKLNVKKSEISDRLSGMTVLGYFNVHGFPYRTDEDLLRHLFFPERPQDMARLAASALGLDLASCGCSERFHNLCEYIWRKIVIEKGIQPKFAHLEWMERTNIISSIEEISELKEFPTRMQLRALTWQYPVRDEATKQRLWPTKPGPRGRFYFLESTSPS